MTIYRGISHPNDEPRTYRFREKKRQFGFDEATAAKVKFDDLYFMMSAPAASRYYIEVRDGEHDIEKGGLACVTHKFVPAWKGADEGKWVEYDSGKNLVIRVDNPEGYEVERVFESAAYNTPLGRAVGHDGMRPFVKGLLEKLGIDSWDEYEGSGHRFTVNPDDELKVKNALKELLEWAPPYGYDKRLGKIGADCDGVGYAENGPEYAKTLNGESDGFKGEGSGKPLPILSEPVYYMLAGGKDGGRSFRARLEALIEACGLDKDDF